MTDHFTEARQRTSLLTTGLTTVHGADPAVVAELIMAVRHQCAEEIRADAAYRADLSNRERWALEDLSGRMDPLRYDPQTKTWKVK